MKISLHAELLVNDRRLICMVQSTYVILFHRLLCLLFLLSPSKRMIALRTLKIMDNVWGWAFYP